MICKAKDAKGLESIDNEFWKEVILTYLDNKTQTSLEDINQSNVMSQILFCNDLIRYKGKVLYFKRWKEKGIQYMKDIIHTTEKRILNVREINTLLGRRSAQTIFELNALKKCYSTKMARLD